ncbi:hypothetical protein SAMN06272722_10995 [Paenibacillus sp. RU5A]|nr:hypothetical protein SAMN06272722_10995 [Paenibacillus sp. RU5A]SOC73655.1 hypothetical protein SAMN05880581_10995 [Paenibacillus sp. RU26A]SOC75830.1 hypothetical protein SAMN05880586_10995 [Paenibacillus sp. RU5M]
MFPTETIGELEGFSMSSVEFNMIKMCMEGVCHVLQRNAMV